MNIEDIHCQIVMRVQRNKQLLRELEGGPPEPQDPNWDSSVLSVSGIGGMSGSDMYHVDLHNGQHGVTRQSSTSKGPQQMNLESMPTVIPVKEQDVLGPDFCTKRPVFLNLEL